MYTSAVLVTTDIQCSATCSLNIFSIQENIMEVQDDLLHTPVISLDPVSEISKVIYQRQEKMSNIEKDAGRKKLKILPSARERTEKRNKNTKLRSSPDSSSSSWRKKEILCIQMQRALIADEDGDRPIHIAVAQEDVALVEKLCFLMKKAKKSVDITNYLRQTPLHIAIIVRNITIVKILLNNGASVKCQNRNGNNAIHLAVRYFDEEVFNVVLQHCSKSILDSTDYEGCTAIHYAVNLMNINAVKGLHSAGADINALDGKSGRSCLAQAVVSGHLDMMKVLLRCGGRVDSNDYYGQNVLELAIQTGNRSAIKILQTFTKESNRKLSDISPSDCGTIALNNN